jgi:diaminopimelate decarboxylase
MSNAFLSFSIKDFVLHSRTSCYFFNLTEIEKNIQALMSMSDERLKFIFPVKSFPRIEVLELAARHMNGFDVSNATELELVKPHLKPNDLVWSSAPQVWAPTMGQVVMDGAHLKSDWPKNTARALRVSLSAGQFHSRFGTSLDQLTAQDLTHHGITALHFHHGEIPVNLSAVTQGLERLAKLVEACPQIQQVNLGGGFTGLTTAEVGSLVASARRLLPQRMVVFEPGRWLCGSAGLLIGSVTETIPHVVATLSRDGHLRWQREPFTIAIHPMQLSEPQKFSSIKFVGASCNEADQLGEISSREISVAKGDLVVVNNVTGYSLAWNHSFNGVPAADAVFFRAPAPK